MVSVLMPTRGRADMWLNNLVQSAMLAKTDPEYVVYVDNDDPQLEQYKRNLVKLTKMFQRVVDVKFIIGEPKTSAKAMKYVAGVGKHNYFIFGTDDLNWRTEGWDEKLISKMPDHQLSVILPASLPNNQIKAPIPFFTKKWRDLTGLFPDDFVHFGPDGWILKIAERAGTKIDATDIEILHSKIKDDTSFRARRFKAMDWKKVIARKEKEIADVVAKVRFAIG